MTSVAVPVACAGDDAARAALGRLAAGGPDTQAGGPDAQAGGPDAAGDAPPPDPRVGVHVERGDAWGLVRQSATEPVLRITVEARDAPTADRLHDELQSALAAPTP